MHELGEWQFFVIIYNIYNTFSDQILVANICGFIKLIK